MHRDMCCLHARVGVGIQYACLSIVTSIGLSSCGTTSRPVNPPVNISANSPTAAVLGYIWDSRVPGLRSVTGALGAANLGQPLLGGSTFTTATPCSGKSFALLTTSAGEVVMMSLPVGQQSQLVSPIAKNEHVLLSPKCSSALVYAPGSANATVVTGLPSSPQFQSLTIDSADSIVGAAVSDTGSLLLAGFNSDGTTTVQFLSASGAPLPLKRLQKYGAMSFVAGSDTAVIADSGANAIFLARSLATNPTFTQLGSSTDGVSSPLAAASSGDGHYAFVANASGGTILRFDLTGASKPTSISCTCPVSELLPLFGNAVFQLNDPAAGTIFALEGDARTPRTIFIPTDKMGSSSGSAQ